MLIPNIIIPYIVNKDPIKNHIESFRSFFIFHSYQKIRFKAANTVKIITAQNTGRCLSFRCPSDGSSVHPLTNPTNWESGFGFVI
jgi:hypothetical protein